MGTTKAFVSLLIGMLVLGGSLGGAFVGGMALGKSQEAEASQDALPALPSSSLAQGFSGELSQEERDRFRQQFQAQLGGGDQGFTGRGFPGGTGLTGTIERVEGNAVTVNTPQGPLQVTIGADTTIQMFTVGAQEDLLAGVRVTVTGQRGEDSTVQATRILIVPEGEDNLFGGGSPFGGRRQQDLGAP
jgi:hypothetical protein